MTMDIRYSDLDTPIGSVRVYLRNERVVALGFDHQRKALEDHLEKHFGAVRFAREPKRSDAVARLSRYFDGDVQAMKDIPVELAGTPFERQVWKRLRSIPAGKTASYADIARAIGRPRAVRAVGTANGKNPVSIVVPCHRVIGSDGRLHGYGGGLHRKQWLLDHELRNAASR
jgi:methylated-DNA-[protein]-cysteine S-methyltransferase